MARFLALAVIVGAWLGIALSLLPGRFMQGDFLDRHRWSLAAWETRTLINIPLKWAGHWLDDVGRAEADELLVNYFELTSQVRALTDAADPAQSIPVREDRSHAENRVEAILTDRLTEVLHDEGLTQKMPLFGTEVVWPPVAFELTEPPSLLVLSPRNEIRQARSVLLRADLGFLEALELEEYFGDEDTSALVVPLGGLAAYPAIVPEDRNYFSVISTAAHEWVHHYLAFFPLGRAYGKDGDMVTVNETVASILGDELAQKLREKYPLDFPLGDGSAPSRRTGNIDFNAEMRQLRLKVDTLLAKGHVREAEALMEETRLRFQEEGIFIRKINQAYFAFYGSYGDSPQSSSPIGPKIQEIRALSGSIGEFVANVRDIARASDLDAVLERLRAEEEG